MVARYSTQNQHTGTSELSVPAQIALAENIPAKTPLRFTVYTTAFSLSRGEPKVLYLWLRVGFLRREFQAQFSVIKSGT